MKWAKTVGISLLGLLLAGLLWVFWKRDEPVPSGEGPWFVEVTDEVGLRFRARYPDMSLICLWPGQGDAMSPARRPDKHWSLTDCTSFVVMTDHKLSHALTADDHQLMPPVAVLISPPRAVTSAANAAGDMLAVRKCTEPSAKTTLAPPVWKL